MWCVCVCVRARLPSITIGVFALISKMKSQVPKWLQDTKSTLSSFACTRLYSQKISACLHNGGEGVTCGPCVKLESPHIMSSFVPTCLLIISETINPNAAVASVSESRTRLEGLKNTGIDKAPGFYPRTNLLPPDLGPSRCVLPSESCRFHVRSLRNPRPGF